MDNRIQFPVNEIDFSQVGFTGQTHDNYPSPDTSPRYDWMSLYLKGLLSNQSSVQAPCTYRYGTMWYSLGLESFYCYSSVENISQSTDIDCDVATYSLDSSNINNGNFKSLSYAIELVDRTNIYTLRDFLVNINRHIKINRNVSIMAGEINSGNYDVVRNGIIIPDNINDASDGLNSILYTNGYIINTDRYAYDIDNKIVLLKDFTLNYGTKFVLFLKYIDYNIAEFPVVMNDNETDIIISGGDQVVLRDNECDVLDNV